MDVRATGRRTRTNHTVGVSCFPVQSRDIDLGIIRQTPASNGLEAGLGASFPLSAANGRMGVRPIPPFAIRDKDQVNAKQCLFIRPCIAPRRPDRRRGDHTGKRTAYIGLAAERSNHPPLTSQTTDQ